MELEAHGLLIELELVLEVGHGQGDASHRRFGMDGKFGFRFGLYLCGHGLPLTFLL
jgi:hypothetical protein